MLGSWVRAPASSPDDCRNAVVFFYLWYNCVIMLKRIFVYVCKHPHKFSLPRYAEHINHKQKKWLSCCDFGWGYLGRVVPHRASATCGTPSVTAKAVRAPKRWYNCVIMLKRIFVSVCKHPHKFSLPRYAEHINHKQKKWLSYCGFGWGYLGRIIPFKKLKN